MLNVFSQYIAPEKIDVFVLHKKIVLVITLSNLRCVLQIFFSLGFLAKI